MAIDRVKTQNELSEQNIQNASFDKEFNVNVSEGLGYDGVNLQRKNADILAMKITKDGEITYIAIAAPATAQATAKWLVKKIDKTDPNNIVISWAGNGSFNQIATDLTGLTYS